MPPGCNVLNNAKPFSGMVYLHICLSGDANQTVSLLIALWKYNKILSGRLELLDSI